MNIPANRAQIVLTCQSLIPVLPNCTSTSILPFESVVYDANNDGLFNAGDSVIVGASPPVGTHLAYDTGLKWRDATCTSANFATCHWTASDPIFYSPATNTSVAGRVFLYGAPTTLTTFIHVTGATPTCTNVNFATCTDLHIKFAQTDNCGAVACTTLQGVVEVKGKLVNVGGILADGSEQDVMAQQIIYTFNPSVLQALCTVTPCGATLPGQFDAFCVNSPTTCASPVAGHYTFAVDAYCQASGGSPLDTISPDNANGKISSSSLCSQGPPSNSDTGIGCDPNYFDPVRTGGATCPGNYFGPPAGIPGFGNPPALNMTSMVVEFLVTGFSSGFTIQNVASAPGVSGSSLTDIDGVTSTNIPVVLVSTSFSNMAAHTSTTGVSCSPSSISVNTLTTCTATVTDPAASGAVKPSGSVSFQSSGSGIFNPTSCILASGATLNAATCSATYNATAVGTGTHTITGVYNGDGSHQGSLGTFPVTVSGAAPLTITANCGTNTGTVGKPITCTSAASGGTKPYTFGWKAPGGSPATAGNQTTFTVMYATKGTFTVNATLTDSTGKTVFQLILVTINGQPIVDNGSCGTATAGKPVTCTASPTGGTGPYTITWASSGSPGTGTGASYTTTFATKGSFTVTLNVTDANRKFTVQTITVVVGGQPIVDNGSCGTATAGKPVTCNAAPTGGTTPYTITWRSTGSPATGTGTSYTTTFATKGTFSVTLNVTDANRKFTVQTISVVVAGQPIVDNGSCGTATAGKPVTCNAAPTGGTTPYTITWRSTGSPATGTGASYTTTFATKGTFSVTLNVTDANSKFTVQTISVSVTAQPIVVTASCNNANVNSPVNCTASATGGTSPITFAWSAPGGTPSSGTGPTFTTSYGTTGNKSINVTATDTNNQHASKIIVVSIGAALQITASCAGGANTGTVGKPVACSASATGGTPPYTFSWSAPGGSPASAGNVTSFTVTYSAKGTFNINATVTDRATPTGKSSVLIPVTITGQPIVDNGSCGTATAGKPVTCNAAPTGGTAPYTITWRSTGTPATGTGASYTTTFATKGTFSVTLNVTDANRKFTVQTISVVVAGQPIVDNGSCGAATAGKPVTCNAAPTGGTTPYTITWASTGSPATGTGASYTTTFAAKGTFSVTLNVTDANRKFTVQTISVVVAGQPIVDNGSCGAATAGKPVTCNAAPTGGTTPYTITWRSTGTPATGSGTSYTTTFATKGSFSVTLNVTDANRKFTVQTITVAVAAQPIVDNGSCGAATAGKPVTCTASPTGGTTPYTIRWSSTGSPATGTGASYTTTFATKGTFSVTLNVTDVNAKFTVQTISVVVAGQPIVDNGSCGVASAGKPVTCTASPTGGTTPYTISWRSTGTPATGTGASYTTTFATKGTFSVTLNVTDANRKFTVQTVSVSVTAQPIVITASCNNANVNSPVNCTVSATGGTSPITFAWSAPGGTPSSGTGPTFTTSYSTTGNKSINVTATDTNNQHASKIIVVSIGAALQITASCAGGANTGTVGKPVACTASASGGTPPYTFSWSAPGGSPASAGNVTSFTVTYSAKGTFNINATVTDRASIMVAVERQRPVNQLHVLLRRQVGPLLTRSLGGVLGLQRLEQALATRQRSQRRERLASH